MFCTYQDRYQLGSLSYLPRINKRRPDKPISLTVQASFTVAIKFDIEISTVLKNAKRSNSVTSSLVSPSQKKARERRSKLVEADQKQEDKKL